MKPLHHTVILYLPTLKLLMKQITIIDVWGRVVAKYVLNQVT